MNFRIQPIERTIFLGCLVTLNSLSIALASSLAPAQKVGTPRILFFESSPATRQDNIVTMDADGTHQIKLDTGAGTALTADWSHDGCRILYKLGIRNDTDRSNRASLYLTPADGSNPKVLADNVDNGPEYGLQTRFSPDGSQIVFVSRSNDIMVINSDGTGGRKLTTQLYAFQPSWSPDGTKILFMTNGLPQRIRVMNADGTNLQDIGGGSDAQSSPDGSKISFVQNSQYPGDIAVMTADGKDVKLLTDGSRIVRYPSWSPDGSKIAFHSIGEEDIVLEVMNADGSHRIKIADHLFLALEVGQGASWSPDSSTLAIQRMPLPIMEMGAQLASKGMQALTMDIYLVGSDGSSLRKLTTSGVNMNPKWSAIPKCQGK